MKNVNVLKVGTGKNRTTAFYIETKKVKIFEQKKLQITKRELAFKGFASTYNVEIF